MRYFILEKQILSNSENVLPFYWTKTSNQFLSSMISANHDKGDGFFQIYFSFYKSVDKIEKIE